MARGTVSKPEYKEIVKKYNSLCGSHQLWELWQDSMTMFALSISNTVDSRFRDKRASAQIPPNKCNTCAPPGDAD